jgi:hypothetical protein
MLAGPVVTPVKRDQERQYLAQGQRRRAQALTLAAVQQTAVIDGLKGRAELVNSAEDGYQLVHRGFQVMPGSFVVESAKQTGASCFFKV